MAVKKMIYKHLNSLGFKKCGHNCVKRIGDSNYYGMVALERDRHYSFYDERESAKNNSYTYVSDGKTFYDLRCEIVYIRTDIPQNELVALFKDTDITYSLNSISSHRKYRFFKESEQDDQRVVKALMDFFFEMFYNPVYQNIGRSLLTYDDGASLFCFTKAFYQSSQNVELSFSETLANMAYEEGKYEEAVYYAKTAMIYHRPQGFKYSEALENFNKVFAVIKENNDDSLSDIINIYEKSAKKIYSRVLR